MKNKFLLTLYLTASLIFSLNANGIDQKTTQTLSRYSFNIYFPSYLIKDMQGSNIKDQYFYSKKTSVNDSFIYLSITFYRRGQVVYMYNNFTIKNFEDAFSWETLLQLKGNAHVDEATKKAGKNVITARGLGIYTLAIKDPQNYRYCIISIEYSEDQKADAINVINNYLKYSTARGSNN